MEILTKNQLGRFLWDTVYLTSIYGFLESFLQLKINWHSISSIIIDLENIYRSINSTQWSYDILLLGVGLSSPHPSVIELRCLNQIYMNLTVIFWNHLLLKSKGYWSSKKVWLFKAQWICNHSKSDTSSNWNRIDVFLGKDWDCKMYLYF